VARPNLYHIVVSQVLVRDDAWARQWIRDLGKYKHEGRAPLRQGGDAHDPGRPTERAVARPPAAGPRNQGFFPGRARWTQDLRERLELPGAYRELGRSLQREKPRGPQPGQPPRQHRPAQGRPVRCSKPNQPGRKTEGQASEPPPYRPGVGRAASNLLPTPYLVLGETGRGRSRGRCSTSR